ncbi:hypothetical protein GY45DRAFT_478919 [Cubamyces sp. BRFM 1775]|nr:hypothetical protein GY45DRAFT_478919 [Cubamyces sp. BRFM 1775]
MSSPSSRSRDEQHCREVPAKDAANAVHLHDLEAVRRRIHLAELVLDAFTVTQVTSSIQTTVISNEQMTEEVPDEVLDVILASALVIPERTFEAWRLPHTFSGTPRSTVADLLLVSKRWHDIGKPWLYESAIVRTREQMDALAIAVAKDHKNGRKLGWYMRRLRIDSGYADPAFLFLRHTPKIVSLFLGFDISIDDQTQRLMRALRTINPCRLYMDSMKGLSTDIGYRSSSGLLANAVAGALPYWTHLTRMDTSPEFIWLVALVPPLRELKSLSTVSMSNHSAMHRTAHDVIEALIANPSVKTIQIRDGARWLAWKGPRPDYDKSKIYLGEGKRADFPQVDLHPPSFPLPQLPDKLWKLILKHATARSRVAANDHVNATRCAIILVNKHFYGLGLEFLYARPFFVSERAVDGFLVRVTASAPLAALVEDLDLDGLPLTGQKFLCAPLIGLRRVTRALKVFPTLLEYVTDREILLLTFLEQGLSRQDILTQSAFSPFVHLRRLALYGGSGSSTDEPRPDILSNLERLALYDPGPGLVDVFSSLHLSSLREFEFERGSAPLMVDFLTRHGDKLHRLNIDLGSGTYADDVPVFDFCPNATTLHLNTSTPPSAIPFMNQSKPHPCLRLLVFPKVAVQSRSDMPPGIEQWNDFIISLTQMRHKLLALEEIRTLAAFEWPLHQDEYQRAMSCAAHIAYDLHKIGIHLSDAGGTRWARFDPIKREEYQSYQARASASRSRVQTVPLPVINVVAGFGLVPPHA